MNSRCPGWLFSQKGIQRIKGDNNTYLTDYNDPKFAPEAVKAIQALANHYDNDPRVDAFELGILGYWGEWHTSGFSAGGVSYSISDATKAAILNAFKTSFTKAKIQGRYPWAEPLKSTGGIGFHNDYFVPYDPSTEGFNSTVSSSGQWLNGPIGGEVPPRDAASADTEKKALWGAKGESMISTGHYSTMAPGAYRVASSDTDYSNFLKLHRMMGYNYQIDSATFADTLPAKSAISIQLATTNIGVAPIYYDWQVQFALLDNKDLPITLASPSFRLTTVNPGGGFTISANLPTTGVDAGSYRLAVRIIQPGASSAKASPWLLDARNTYILFANDLATVDGSWDANNALIGAWSVLGTIALR